MKFDILEHFYWFKSLHEFIMKFLFLTVQCVIREKFFFSFHFRVVSNLKANYNQAKSYAKKISKNYAYDSNDFFN